MAVETRHESWWCDEVRTVLTERGAAHVWADRGGHPLGPTWRTADWRYLRLHHGDADPPPNDHCATLGSWADHIAATFDADHDVFTSFDNDPRCAAVDNATTFGDEVARAGLVVAHPADPSGQLNLTRRSAAAVDQSADASVAASRSALNASAAAVAAARSLTATK